MTTVSTSLHSGRGPALSGAGPVSSKKRGKGRQTRLDRTYYWMTVPAALIFAFFLYVPFIQGILYSFTNSQGFGTYKWIGLKNYIALFQDDRVWHAYGFSIFITVVCTVLINLIAMFLAVLLNSRIADRKSVV